MGIAANRSLKNFHRRPACSASLARQMPCSNSMTLTVVSAIASGLKRAPMPARRVAADWPFRSPAITALESRIIIIPYRCVERLATVDNLFEILGEIVIREIVIQGGPGFVRLRPGDTLLDRTAGAFHGLDNGH